MTGAGKICVIYTGGTLGMVPSELAAMTKLHGLFARGLPAGEIARRMPENLRAELTPMAA